MEFWWRSIWHGDRKFCNRKPCAAGQLAGAEDLEHCGRSIAFGRIVLIAQARAAVHGL